jgi:hypothetical protein
MYFKFIWCFSFRFFFYHNILSSPPFSRRRLSWTHFLLIISSHFSSYNICYNTFNIHLHRGSRPCGISTRAGVLFAHSPHRYILISHSTRTLLASFSICTSTHASFRFATRLHFTLFTLFTRCTCAPGRRGRCRSPCKTRARTPARCCSPCAAAAPGAWLSTRSATAAG